MKKHLLVKTALSGLFATLCTVGIVSFPACQKQDYDYSEKDDLDPALLNSPELEEYIIAGADFQQTLNIFKDEISKIDFSKLEFVEETPGKKIMRLPISVHIEEKSRIFKEKKEALLTKHPLFSSLSESTKYDYFRICIQNSIKVNNRLLELGIDINQPTTKASYTEGFENKYSVLGYLAEWMQNSNYTEVIIIVFEDGSATIIHDDENFTPTQATIPSLGYDGKGNFYYDNKKIDFVGHTHTSGPEPNGKDLENPDGQYTGLDQAIYYDGAFHHFQVN